MIKECKVISYNKFLNILVFDYEGTRIQTTSVLNNETRTVFVKYKNGKYEIVNKDDYDKYNRESRKRILLQKLQKKKQSQKMYQNDCIVVYVKNILMG